MKAAKKNLAQWTLLSTLFVVTGYVLTFAMNTLVSRHSSPAIFGDFSLALRALGVVCILIMMGTDNASKRFLSQYVESGDEAKAQQYIRWNLKFLSRTFLICMSASLFMIGVMLLLHYAGLHALDNHHLAIYVLFLTPIFALVMLLSAFMASYGAYVIASIYDKVFYALVAVFYLLIFVILIDDSLGTTQLFWFMFIVLGIVFLTQILYVMFRLPTLYQSVSAAAKRLKEQTKEVFPKVWLKSALWMFSGNFVIAIAGMTDLLILELIHVSEGVVGHYAAATNIAFLLLLISTGTSYVLSARVSSLKGKSGSSVNSALQKESNLVTYLNVGLGALTFMILLAFGHKLLALYGQTFVSIYPQLVWVSFAYFVSTAFGSASTVLLFSGNEHVTFYVDLIEYLCRLVLGVTLTLMYGLNGLVAATVICITLKFLVMGYFVRRRVGIKPLIII